MKVSHNNSRTQGSASHNDRTFDVKKADHIDQSRMEDNRYWCIYEGMSFEDAERKFYEEHYGQMIQDQNRYRQEKLDAGDYLKMSRYCPEELILQIGNVDDTVKDPAVFDACFDQYMAYLEEWNREHGEHMHVLDYAVHKDEATIHAHVRRVWDYTAKDGTTRIGLDRALKEAGVCLPDSGMPEGRRNNRKMTFDHMMRGRWIEICEEHGITVDKVPKKDRHQRINDYKRDRRIEEIEHARGNTRMVSALVKSALGEIPEEKWVISGDGKNCVCLTEEEFGILRRSAAHMVLDKNEAKQRDEEAFAARERAGKAMEQADILRERNTELEQEIMKLKERIEKEKSGLLPDVMQEGMQAIRESEGLELEVMGETGQAYDVSRYGSVYEAMDYLEEAWVNRELGYEKNERGGD